MFVQGSAPHSWTKEPTASLPVIQPSDFILTAHSAQWTPDSYLINESILPELLDRCCTLITLCVDPNNVVSWIRGSHKPYLAPRVEPREDLI
jgi:hypothetical protein